MVAYQQFVELSESTDSNARGQAAHFAATAFVAHHGSMDEHAALYAALVCFLDDVSVKVRAALAYGLLHTKDAPRPIMVSLLNDAPVIARAVAQYSPVLVDADLLPVVVEADSVMLDVIAHRPTLSVRVAQALLARDVFDINLAVISRTDVALGHEILCSLAEAKGSDAKLRGALLKRTDLPAKARFALIERVRADLSGARIVKGAVAPKRLERLFQDSVDAALTKIGEGEDEAGQADFCAALEADDHLSIRVLLHALISGRIAFFSACLGRLGGMPRAKVATLLASGSRAGLNAMFTRCGMGEALRNLLARLIMHARSADLADDLAARHFVVTALLDELLSEHDGVVPAELEEAFAYLNAQNVSLARKAARGVMPAFANGSDDLKTLPGLPEALAALPAA